MVKSIRMSWESHEAHFPKISVFIWPNLMLRHYFIQNVIDGIQIRINIINNESVNHFSQFILIKVK